MFNAILTFRIIVMLSSISILAPVAYAQRTWITLNPGFKLGYEFGEQSGFVFGGEISMVFRNSDHLSPYGGVVRAFDGCRGLQKLHLGIEGGDGIVGICIGPSLLSKDGEHDVGLTITPYAGAILIPYFSATLSSRFGGIYDVGSYIKIPFSVKGEPDFE